MQPARADGDPAVGGVMTTVATLRRVPFFAILPEDELAGLAERMRPRQYRAGHIIFHQDDPGTTLAREQR